MNEKVLSALADIDNIYRDKEYFLAGTMVNGQFDGGDSSHKQSHIAIAEHLLGMESEAVVNLAIMHKHGLVRHPDPNKWYSNPHTFSRDQFSPRVIAASLLGITSAVRQYFFAHLKHLLLFAWNDRPSWNEGTKWKMPDITGPESWGLYIRGLRCYLLYPILFLLDLDTLISSITKRYDSDPDINNNLAAVIHAMKIMPTGIGHLAFKIIKPVLVQKLQQYWTKTNAEPPIDVLYIEALKQQGYL